LLGGRADGSRHARDVAGRVEGLPPRGHAHGQARHHAQRRATARLADLVPAPSSLVALASLAAPARSWRSGGRGTRPPVGGWQTLLAERRTAVARRRRTARRSGRAGSRCP